MKRKAKGHTSALKIKTAIDNNRYTVLNSRVVELRIAYKGRLVKALIDKGDYARVKKYHWGCFKYYSSLRIALWSGKYYGQSLQNFIFDNKKTSFDKIPLDRDGRFDFRKKNLLQFVRGNHYLKVNKNAVELRFKHKDELIRILIDKQDRKRVSAYTWVGTYTQHKRFAILKKGGVNLHNFILGEKGAVIKEIPRDRQGRLDYRKKTLLSLREDSLNTYRILTQKDMLLKITKKGETFDVRFDREDYQRIKSYNWRVAPSINDRKVVVSVGTQVSLARAILNDPSMHIKKIPLTRHGRFDYRKASLIAAMTEYTNTYRFLNKKKVELLIANKDKELRVIFDREDYERVRKHHWYGAPSSSGTIIVDGKNKTALTKFIFGNQPIDIEKIPVDPQGRLDYRKAVLLSAIKMATNTYRTLNQNEIELLIAKKDKKFRVIFDREDYERVKKHHWRIAKNDNSTTVVCNKTLIALTKVILKNKSIHIRKKHIDSQGRLDYRKASLLSEAVENTYHILSQKEVELRITKGDEKYRIIFDREDYERIKAHRWVGGYSRAKSSFLCSRTQLALSKIILQNKSIRITRIPLDFKGRFDYRKASLISAMAQHTNTYRLLNNKENVSVAYLQ